MGKKTERAQLRHGVRLGGGKKSSLYRVLEKYDKKKSITVDRSTVKYDEATETLYFEAVYGPVWGGCYSDLTKHVHDAITKERTVAVTFDVELLSRDIVETRAP